jgi:outer membrane protein assembly factor BamD
MLRFMRFTLYTAVIAFAACGSSDLPEAPTAEQRFRFGHQAYLDGKYLDALNHFEVIRLQYPASSVADSARFFTGMARFNREEYVMASFEFNQLIQGGVSRELLPESYYMFAQCYYEMSPKVQLDQTNTLRSIDALQNFVEAYPSHEKAGQAERQVLELVDKLAKKEFDTAVLYERMENREAALVYYNTVVDRYYNTTYAEPSAAAKIRILLRFRRYAEVERAARDFLDRYPESRFRDDVRRQREEAAELRRAGSAENR